MTNTQSFQEQPNHDKVDYTFLHRYEVQRLIDKITDDDSTSKEGLENIMEHLNKLEKHVFPVVADRLRNAASKEASLLGQILMMMEDSSKLGDKLLNMLFDPKIPDRNKNYILKVMDFHGLKPEVFSYNDIFNNPDRAIRDARKSLYKQLKNNTEIIPQVLTELTELSVATQDAMFEDAVYENDVLLVPFLKAVALSDDASLAPKAVSTLGELKYPESKEALQELLAEPDRQFLKENIERQINRLTLRGVENKQQKTENVLDKLGEVYQGAVSQIDGFGNRLVFFARRWEGKGLLVANYLINTSGGIRDCWGHFKITTKMYNDLLKEFRSDNTLVTVDTDYARSIFCDALYITNASKKSKPPEFGFWRQCMPDEWLKEEGYTPKIDEDVLQRVLHEKGLDKELEKLAEYYDFQNWFLHHPYVYELMSKVTHIPKDGEGYIVPIATQEEVENIHNKLIEHLIIPNLDFYKRNLLLTADFYKKRGLSKRYRTVVYALLKIGDGDISSVRKHPLFRAMIKRSLDKATTNLREGLDLREDPEEFDF
ncbi:hypothetical protein [Natranaerobius trueperi]|uniref:HEAT repeat domain-containing protein n=1 Tax=Natranaerobius trueperi TaxID=759412 RepID=A0A226C394_9FIRM|nr:hypothetical protein [Natranaerobius trueperi]OWZ84929.1 hypothetical protein CDO51_00555 [Natranaerobius trueperi]